MGYKKEVTPESMRNLGIEIDPEGSLKPRGPELISNYSDYAIRAKERIVQEAVRISLQDYNILFPEKGESPEIPTVENLLEMIILDQDAIIQISKELQPVRGLGIQRELNFQNEYLCLDLQEIAPFGKHLSSLIVARAKIEAAAALVPVTNTRLIDEVNAYRDLLDKAIGVTTKVKEPKTLIELLADKELIYFINDYIENHPSLTRMAGASFIVMLAMLTSGCQGVYIPGAEVDPNIPRPPATEVMPPPTATATTESSATPTDEAPVTPAVKPSATPTAIASATPIPPTEIIPLPTDEISPTATAEVSPDIAGLELVGPEMTEAIKEVMPPMWVYDRDTKTFVEADTTDYIFYSGKGTDLVITNENGDKVGYVRYFYKDDLESKTTEWYSLTERSERGLVPIEFYSEMGDYENKRRIGQATYEVEMHLFAFSTDFATGPNLTSQGTVELTQKLAADALKIKDGEEMIQRALIVTFAEILGVTPEDIVSDLEKDIPVVIEVDGKPWDLREGIAFSWADTPGTSLTVKDGKLYAYTGRFSDGQQTFNHWGWAVFDNVFFRNYGQEAADIFYLNVLPAITSEESRTPVVYKIITDED